VEFRATRAYVGGSRVEVVWSFGDESEEERARPVDGVNSAIEIGPKVGPRDEVGAHSSRKTQQEPQLLRYPTNRPDIYRKSD
jgi:hypothetical protein